MTVTNLQTPLRQRTVGDIAATVPGATATFRKFKVDFCCHGNIALDEAARQRGIDPLELEQALNALGASDAYAPALWTTGELIEHILARYHETHRRELPELIKLAKKVEAVHVDHPKAPHGLASLLHRIEGELEAHMKKEELILFPAMASRPDSRLDGPISQMRLDHEDHANNLREVESITDEFALPQGACRSWQALYLGTSKLVNDVREHIHLENNVLFRRHEAAQ